MREVLFDQKIDDDHEYYYADDDVEHLFVLAAGSSRSGRGLAGRSARCSGRTRGRGHGIRCRCR